MGAAADKFCAECGGSDYDHPEDPHFRYGDHSGPHAKMGLVVTATGPPRLTSIFNVMNPRPGDESS